MNLRSERMHRCRWKTVRLGWVLAWPSVRSLHLYTAALLAHAGADGVARRLRVALQRRAAAKAAGAVVAVPLGVRQVLQGEEEGAGLRAPLGSRHIAPGMG